jgi:hypothetical protein
MITFFKIFPRLKIMLVYRMIAAVDDAICYGYTEGCRENRSYNTYFIQGSNRMFSRFSKNTPHPRMSQDIKCIFY